MITFHRTLTVSKNTASLNEPLYMFRGDGDILIILDLIQTIRNMKFGKVSSTNVITDGLIYSTVCIYKPSGELAFVTKGEIVENQMQVTLLKDVMDEVIEIGEHKLQIHLFDEDENRLTLPEVGQIYIAEPLCENSHIEPIDTTAIVGRSTVGTCVVADDPAILADGYLTYNWQTGEYITSAKLNNMIMGIDEALSGIKIDFSDYALKSEIPTKTSQLTNDSNFLTSVPSEYITETELNAKGYLTSHQDISGKADKSEIPTKTSQLTNDSDFITSENINSLFDIDYDSLLAFDTNEIISKPNYDDGSNYIDNDNNLILDDDLPAGTYTLKYEFEDGSYSDITSFIIDDNDDNEDVLENLPEGTTYELNARWSGSANATSKYNGAIAYKIPINIGKNSSLKLTIANLPSVIETATMNKIYYIDRDGTLVVGYDTLSQDFHNINPSFVSFLNGGKTMEIILTPQTNHEYIAVSFLASSADGTAITEDDMKNFIISLEEIDRQQILTLPTNSTLVYDSRFNESSGTISENGGVVTIHIPVTGDGNTTYDVNIEGLPNPTIKESANKIYYQNGDGSYINPELSSIYFQYMTANEITFADDLKSCNLKITPASGVAYIVLTLLISASNGTYIAVSGKPMLNTVKVSLEKEGGSN